MTMNVPADPFMDARGRFTGKQIKNPDRRSVRAENCNDDLTQV